MAYLPVTSLHMQKKYCLGDYHDCARYVLASAGIDPPTDLYPNEMDRAKEILQSKNRSQAVR